MESNVNKYVDLSPNWPVFCDPIRDEAFEDQIERMLRPLWGMRLRVSLFAIRINSLTPEKALTMIDLAFADIGSTGALSNGDGVLLYIGPRPPGPDSDCRLEQRVADVMGWTVFNITEHCTVAGVDVVAVHRWLNELSYPSDLTRELYSNPAIHQPDKARPRAPV